MASIYNISPYDSGDYLKNNIVSYGGYHYYARKDGNIASNPTPNHSDWAGVTNHNGIDKPHFFWKPSYSTNVNKHPKVKSIKFGDGYEQRVQDGINNNLTFLDLTFDNRSEREAAAILHFLEIRKGQESFVFTPHSPYNKAGLYLCRGWDSSFVFYNNYSIKFQLEEVVD